MQVKSWIMNGLNQEAIISAEQIGKELAEKRLSTSQIRAAFGEVRRLQMRGITDSFDSSLLLLKPKLAYAQVRKAGVDRNAAEAAGKLLEVLSQGIDGVVESKDAQTKLHRFENFAAFFEAILAYHRANGGK
jgi:CRISPR-associated protein Csm2